MSSSAWENLSRIMDRGSTTLAICPDSEDALPILKDCNELVIFTPFKDQIDKFSNARMRTESSFPQQMFKQILFVPTKNKRESLAYLSLGLDCLSTEGEILFACDNEFGAKGYMAQLKNLAEDIEFESKRKGRFAKISKSRISNFNYNEWKKDFSYQLNEAGFNSFPGIYGWNKVDHASRLLVSSLPELQGTGADFGCGYGYISTQLKLEKMRELHLIENDCRALECAKKNLPQTEKIKFHWADIENESLDLPPLDFVVMNPPFHEGHEKKTDLGIAFIKKARKSLKKEGRLFLVANQFLPYEDVLMNEFGRMTRVLKQDGFKVIHV